MAFTHIMNLIFLGELKERMVKTLTPIWTKVPNTSPMRTITKMKFLKLLCKLLQLVYTIQGDVYLINFKFT